MNRHFSGSRSHSKNIRQALHASKGDHKTTLTCKKCIYTVAKEILYAKLTYCDYPNKNFEYLELRITTF